MDDLLDLNFSPPSNIPQSNPSSSRAAPVPSPAFDFLSLNNGFNGSATTRVNVTAVKTPTNPGAEGKGGKGGRSDDAFEGLLGDLVAAGTSGSGSGSGSGSRPGSGMGMSTRMGTNMGMNLGTLSNGSTRNLTLVQRQAQLLEQKKEREERERRAFDFDSWGLTGGVVGHSQGNGNSGNGGNGAAGIGGTGENDIPGPALMARLLPTPVDNKQPTSLSTTTILPTLSITQPRLHPHLPKPPTQSTSTSTSTSISNEWDLDILQPNPISSTKTSQPLTMDKRDEKGQDALWDFSVLTRNTPSVLPVGNDNGNGVKGGDKGDGDFDFEVFEKNRDEPGTRRDEDGRERSDLNSHSHSNRHPHPQPNSRSHSPPPHVVGQIVEMGFTPSQARSVLAQTDTGEDVERAVAILLARADAAGPAAGERGVADRREEEDRERERRNRRRRGPTRSGTGLERESERTHPSSRTDEPFADVTAQADKLIAQASEIGMNVFSRANSLWSQGREKAARLLEERQRMAAAGATGTGNGNGNGQGGRQREDGRPRWMIDVEESSRDVPREPTGRRGGESFKDSDEEDEGPEDPVGRRPTTGARGRVPSPERKRTPVEPPFTVQAKPVDLFTDPEPVYKSAARRKPINGLSLPTKPTHGPSYGTKPAVPVQLKTRPHVPVDPGKVATSSAHKAKGNEHYKLGKFPEALDSYTAALQNLPSGHLLTVPLLNNRASAHLKQGDHSGATTDCTRVITIIGLDYHPSKETPLTGESREIKLPDAMYKAVSKRATAHEMAERWTAAKEDWEYLMGSPIGSVVFEGNQGANQRKMVADGLARTRKMLATPTVRTERPPPMKPKPVVRPRPAQSAAVLSNSEGVAKMRQAAAAKETEDDQRLVLKTGVDEKIQNWSAGKETNLRGLLSSLDLVLGDGFGVKKPTMAELITEKQVKIGYMKVIAKLHPDKLNSTNTTVEQRMIANAVFGILNEAWHAFSGL